MRLAISSVRFIVLWVLCAITAQILTFVVGLATPLVVGLIFFLISMLGPASLVLGPLVAIAQLLATSVMIGLVVGGLQRAVIQMRWDVQLGWWRRATILGTLLGLILVGMAIEFFIRQLPPISNLTSITTIEATRAFLILCGLLALQVGTVALVQSLVLMRYVGHSWLWVLANISGILALVSLVQAAVQPAALPLAIPLILLAMAAPGITTGVTLLWLFGTQGRGRHKDR